jgi:hypothetical protein
MPLSIKFPEPRSVPGEITLYTTPAPDWQPDAVSDLARQLDVTGEVVDRGLWFVVSDGRSALEVYQASHSYRFSRLDIDAEARDGGRQEVERERALAIAERMVQTMAPDESRWDVHSVTDQEVLIAERDAKEPRLNVTGLQVNYTFSLGDLPLLGPGAKMQVAVGPTGDMTGAYRFWREPNATEPAPTIPQDVAFERFSRSNLFADLSDETARAEVTDVRLGYLSMPPTEIQASLVPVYEFRGVLATEIHPRYEFVSYVAAVEMDEASLKSAELTNAPSSVLVA